MINRSNTYHVALAAFVLAIGVFIAFGQSVQFDFINYDDDSIIYENAQVLKGLTPESVAWSFTNAHHFMWMPVTSLSHMLDVSLFGAWAGGHHLVSVLLHALVAVLLFLALRQLTGDTWLSFFAVALFAWHPFRCNSVVWLSSRKDLTSGVVFCLLLLAYVWYARRPSARRYLPLLPLFAVGLMAKPTLMTVPGVFLLLDWWPLRRVADMKQGLRLVVEKLPLILLAAGSALLAIKFQDVEMVNELFPQEPLPIRVADVALRYLHYLLFFFWPFGQAIHYPPLGVERTTFTYGIAFAVLLGITVLTVLLSRRRFVAVGWFWFIGAMAPMIGFIQYGHSYLAARYTYLPHIGLAILTVWGLSCLVRPLLRMHPWQRLIPTGALLACLALAILAHAETRHWRDTESIFLHDIAVTERNDVGHKIVGRIFEERGDYEAALEHFGRAVEASPYNTDGYKDLGGLLIKLGRFADAEPVLAHAAKMDPLDSWTHAVLGLALTGQRKWAEAIPVLRRALELNPQQSETRAQLAIALLEIGDDTWLQEFILAEKVAGNNGELLSRFAHRMLDAGRVDEAIVLIADALEHQPHQAQWRHMLGTMLLLEGKFPEAVAELQAAVRDDPASIESLGNLGIAALRAGDIKGALEAFKRALALEPDSPLLLLNYADALAASGDPATAKEAVAKVLRVEPENEEAKRRMQQLQTPANR